MSGTINLAREVFEHPLLKDGDRFRAWFWMVARACWKSTRFDIGGKMITLDRGQFATSRSLLAEAWGWSPSAVERFLARLETEQMIGRETGQGRTIVTIRNYDKYQFQPEQTGQQAGQATGQPSDSDRTAKEKGNNIIEPSEPIGSSVLANSGSLDLQGGSGEAVPAKPKVTSADIDEAIRQWASAAGKRRWPVPRDMTDQRRKKLAARLRAHGPTGWAEAVTRAYRSPLLSADPPPSWFTFDWLTKNGENILKVLEGNYDRGRDDAARGSVHHLPVTPQRDRTPEELAAARQRLIERGELRA